jgi:DNA/RNA-binding domain of Phe-tRNA-synthetase-like protein
MDRLDYRVDDAVFARFPGYTLGVVVLDRCDNGATRPALEALLRAAEDAVRARLRGNVADLLEVAAWREAYRRFGAKPSEHRSAIEAMLRRVAKPDALPAINPLVDIGNLVSLRHTLPVGVHPVGALPRSVSLRLADPADRFVAAEGAEPETPAPGEVVLASGTDVLTRRWTWRQSIGTRTLADTTRVFFNVDGLPPVDRAQVEAAMREIVDRVAAHCGGRVRASAVLTAANPAFEAGLGD